MDVVKLSPGPCLFFLRWQEETTHLHNQALSLLQRVASFERAGWEQVAPRGKAVALAGSYGTNHMLEWARGVDSL